MIPGIVRIKAITDDMHLQPHCQGSHVTTTMVGHPKWAPNLIWREKVVQWAYDVADHLCEERSVVYIAINILDRYCASISVNSGFVMDGKSYEIASLSCIFLAVQLSGSVNPLLSELVRMSRSGITANDIIRTGASIVKEISLDCKILPPIYFVKSFLQLLPCTPQEVHDSASYLTEIAVCDVVLSHSNASFVGIAACLNAFRSSSPSQESAFLKVLVEITTIEANSAEIQDMCLRLYDVYSRSVDSGNQEDGKNFLKCNKVTSNFIEDFDGGYENKLLSSTSGKRNCLNNDCFDDDEVESQSMKRVKADL